MKVSTAEITKSLDKILSKPLTLGSERRAKDLLVVIGVTKLPKGVWVK